LSASQTAVISPFGGLIGGIARVKCEIEYQTGSAFIPTKVTDIFHQDSAITLSMKMTLAVFTG
jgi:hypothetical protein